LLEPAAREVRLELALDIRRQFRALGRQLGLERGVVFFDKLMEKGPFRVVALVLECTGTRTGLLASRQRQHDRILAWQWSRSQWYAQQNTLCRV